MYQQITCTNLICISIQSNELEEKNQESLNTDQIFFFFNVKE